MTNHTSNLAEALEGAKKLHENEKATFNDHYRVAMELGVKSSDKDIHIYLMGAMAMCEIIKSASERDDMNELKKSISQVKKRITEVNNRRINQFIREIFD